MDFITMAKHNLSKCYDGSEILTSILNNDVW